MVECSLLELMKPEIDVLMRNNLFDYVFDGDMTLERGAFRAGLTPEQFKKEMDAYEKTNRIFKLFNARNPAIRRIFLCSILQIQCHYFSLLLTITLQDPLLQTPHYLGQIPLLLVL